MEFPCFATYFWALDNTNFTFNQNIYKYVQIYLYIITIEFSNKILLTNGFQNRSVCCRCGSESVC